MLDADSQGLAGIATRGRAVSGCAGSSGSAPRTRSGRLSEAGAPGWRAFLTDDDETAIYCPGLAPRCERLRHVECGAEADDRKFPAARRSY
jgi:hypothetical protein